MKVNTKNSEQIFDFLIAFEKQVLNDMRYQKSVKLIEESKKKTRYQN